MGRYDKAAPPVIVDRDGIDERATKALLEALVSWASKWETVYGAFSPHYYADLHDFLPRTG
jgi:hypothetical protein